MGELEENSLYQPKAEPNGSGSRRRVLICMPLISSGLCPLELNPCSRWDARLIHPYLKKGLLLGEANGSTSTHTTPQLVRLTSLSTQDQRLSFWNQLVCMYKGYDNCIRNLYPDYLHTEEWRILEMGSHVSSRIPQSDKDFSPKCGPIILGSSVDDLRARRLLFSKVKNCRMNWYELEYCSVILN